MIESTQLAFFDTQIKVPWGHLAGRWYGSRNVRPILAIHGWQDNLGTWDRLIPLLPRYISVLCIEMPGHGRSTKYPNGIMYHTLDYAYIIKRVVEEYNWSKVSLMGHSMGALSCFIYSALNPNVVDMLIQIDLVVSETRSPDINLKDITRKIEKFMTENEIDNERDLSPLDYKVLETVLHRGSGKSLPKENCKYILNRNIVRSPKYPDKYLFSRDENLKFGIRFVADKEIYLEMAKRISGINHLVIKAEKSNMISNSVSYVIDFLREKNPNFEMYVLNGTHHVHLNNASDVAEILMPFILRHRPDLSAMWSNDQCKSGNSIHNKSKL